MKTALGQDCIRLPSKAVIAAAEARIRQRRKPSPPKPYDDVAVERLRITESILTLARDALDHDWTEFYGLEITNRASIDTGTLYPLLKRHEHAGWLTSRPEDEHEWLARAPPGRGPGRRRTYFTFTEDGKRAALRELDNCRRQTDPSG